MFVKNHDLYKNIFEVYVFGDIIDLCKFLANKPSNDGDLNCPNKSILNKFIVVCFVLFVWRVIAKE